MVARLLSLPHEGIELMFHLPRRQPLVLFVGLFFFVVPARPATAQLVTIAERSGYQETSTNGQVLAHLSKWSQQPHIQVQTIGKSVEGRPLRMAIISREGLKRPVVDDRIVVLLLGGIHSGEAAGKEALLQILAELSQRPDHQWLDQFVILMVPDFNVDGNSRRADHRPTQNGPPLTGTRENAQGLDLNRDFTKLDTPECRALISVIRRWDPHVLMDLHTTNGSRHRYHLTYDVPHHPAVSPKIIAFLRNKLLPEVTETLETDHETPTFFYGNFDPAHSRWTTFGYQGRYSTEYVGLRGRLAILSEAYAYASFETRINATRLFVTTCLNQIKEQATDVRKLLADVRRETANAGRRPLVGDTIAIRGKLTDSPEKRVVRGFESSRSKTPKDYSVDYYGQFVADKAVQRPYAYVIPSSQTRVLRRLRLHGIRVERFKKPHELPVQTATMKSIKRLATFEGHPLHNAQVEWKKDDVRFAKGTYIVRMNQPLASLIANLLEPEADDGLLTWGFFRDQVYNSGHLFPVRRLASFQQLSLETVRTVPAAERLTLDQIYGGSGRVPFSGGFPIGIRWHPQENSWLQQTGGRWVTVDAETGQRRPFQDTRAIQKALVSLSDIDDKSATRLSGQFGQLSPNWDAVLWSHANDLFYHRFGSEEARRLTIGRQTERMPTFSPDGQWVAFVRDRDLYVVSVADGRERRLTTADNDRQFFGELDWVYQEEIYGRGNFKGFWWSPDSRKLALLHLDETDVKSFTVVDHRPYRGKSEITAYPKSGDPIPKVRLGWIDMPSAAEHWLDDPEIALQEHLIVGVTWAPDSSSIIAQVQDRRQTQLDLRRWQISESISHRILLETSPAWVEVLGEPIWLQDQSFLWLSHRTGFRHLYRVDSKGKTVPVTSGDWEIRTVLGIDPKQEWVYFQAAKDPAIRRQAYRIRITGGAVQRITSTSWNHSARPSVSKDFFVDYYSGVHQPPAARLCRGDGTVVRTLQSNVDDRLKHYAINPPEFLQVPARDGHLLDAMLIKPPDFDPQKRYPVIVYVYGGPQAPVVQDRWGGSTYLWHQLLAQQGFVIWMCDNRSSSYRSIRDAFPIHRNLGENELRDITDGLEWLSSHTWVDSSRIGIWGWSYGGYMTSYALTHSRIFRAGIAGAPVTDWRNYDAVYTERYMDLPQTNAAGYKNSSAVAAAAQLHGKLLVVHGTIDDNVHLSNTLQFAEALQKSGKDFEMMLYPGNRHNVANSAQTRDLRARMTRFFLKELRAGEIADNH